MSLIVLLLVVVFIVYVIKTVIKPKNYPPGPRWYPFFGCSNIIHARAGKHGSQWKALSEMSKEYGTQVLGLKMGSELVVVVYGEKNIHFVSEDMDFDARPESFFIKLRTFGKRSGITFVDGPLWRNQRLFTIKGLRKEGFGKDVMESEIQEEVNNLLNKLRNSNGKPVDITLFMSMSTANILWKYVAGEHLKDSKLKKFISLMGSRTTTFTMAGGWLNQWPWLRFIAPKWSGFSIIQRMNVELVEMIQEAINKHINKKVEGSDLMYKYLGEMYNKKQFFSEDQLRGICMDLLIASVQTTNSVLGFAIIILLRNKDIYDKIYNEINTILGKNPPRMTDDVRLVYTSAFLMEIQRKFTVAAFSGPRRALKDTIIDGYCVPKGTTILISLGDLHSDPKLWDEPDEIKPERFIDEKGSLINKKNFYPFGVGRRACPGRPLAKNLLFLVFVSLIQKFKIECSNNVLPSDEPLIGLFAIPKPFTVRFKELI